jgi:L-alanine-DL-glutamate epimerase-like enolase superfamily enzyme
MAIYRRGFVGGALAAGAFAAQGTRAAGPSAAELDKALARPVLKKELFKSPVVVDSIRLLRKDSEYIVHVRSKNGAEGVSFTNGRAYLHTVLKQVVIPYFTGKDVRDLDNLLWAFYRYNSNYKLQGLALWCPHAWVEFAILDMLGRIAGKPMGALVGDIVRQSVAVYVASGRRDSTPEEEVEYLQKLLAESGARAVKYRAGGRMSRNADASPGRTEKLISLSRKALGDSIDIHADANSSYDVPNAVRIGRLLEDIKAVYFEEPCEFDNFEGTKQVTDALAIPVAGGEQESSEWRFRWMIQHRGVDIVQPDLHYYGGMIRSVRVARMAELAKMSTTVHISGGLGFVYMLHFASCVPDVGKYQEYKLGHDIFGKWFEPPITVANGLMTIPAGPGLGIADMKGLLSGAVEV